MVLRNVWSFIFAGALMAASPMIGGDDIAPPPAETPAESATSEESVPQPSAGQAEPPSKEEEAEPQAEKEPAAPQPATAESAKPAESNTTPQGPEPTPAPVIEQSPEAPRAESTKTEPAKPAADAAKPNDKTAAPTESGTTPASKPTPPKDPLAELVDQAIVETSKRKLTAGLHTPWQVVHGILALRWELMLQQPSSSEDVSGIEWITSGVYHDGLPLWEATPYGGRGHPFTRPYAFEGHPTQFMGYMTMANIPLDYEVQTPTKVVTMRDIVNDAKMQVREGVEITWTLWTLAHYEEPDAQWFNAAGEPWSIERLMRLQINEPVTSGACGGCHGLFALAYARNMYLSTGKPLRGVWFEADQKIKRYIEEARGLQNADGSFSTNHFKGPGFSEDFPTRITTSGHQLEWLMIALPQRRLKEEWVRRGIASVASDLVKNRHVASDCGPLYHGLHSLVVYRQRTVPGYLIPKFNSHVKLSERKTKSAVASKPVEPVREARRESPEPREARTESRPASRPSRREAGETLMPDVKPGPNGASRKRSPSPGRISHKMDELLRK
ncbi:MAG: hypothetical protein ACKV0T_25345 [Planctomycetales bacterium]